MHTPLYFVTSNRNKLIEFQTQLNLPIENVDIELDEIQTTDLKSLLIQKLKSAYQEIKAPVIVEDTALFFNAWNALPGPFIKWYLKEMGTGDLVKSLFKFDDKTARAVCGLAYTDGKITQLFEGETFGKIVSPRGKLGFGWDSIFQPKDQNKTFGEMLPNEKQVFSMRYQAINKFNQFLTSRQGVK